MKEPSLRTRTFFAALLWSGGLLAVTHFVFILFARFLPRVLRVHVHAILVVALLFMLAGFFVMRGGLARLSSLGDRLAAIRRGEEHRISGSYPAEVEPLVGELNALLDHREEAVRRALAKAGDLAHGLKTPLAVILHETDRLESHDSATVIRQQIDRMQRQIDLHLAHARAAESGATLGARTVIADSVDALIRALQRLHADRGVSIVSEVAPTHAVRAQREDLDEILGNLLDNACKWAASRVDVRSAAAGDRIVISVDDDGPGIKPELRAAVLQRGVRADEAAPGSGLGLAIAGELVALYRGSLELAASPSGGLSARVTLPRPDAPAGTSAGR